MTEVHQLRTRARAPRPQVRDRIFAATIELLHEVSYGALTIEAVAARAGASKATIYRWWPSKAILVSEAVAVTVEIPAPEPGGTLREDLIAAVGVACDLTARSPIGLALASVSIDLAGDQAASGVFRSRFVDPQLVAVRGIVERATARGELPRGADPSLLLDSYMGAVLFRAAVAGRPVDDDFVVRLVDLLLGSLTAQGGATR